MAKNEPPKLTPRTFDSLFRGPQAQPDGAPILLPIDKLEAYKNHPFRLYEGERLDTMVDSIRQNGIINPIIARPKANGNYEILAGHNRVNAGRIAGLKEAPAFVNDVDDDTAALIVVETNLSQRSTTDMLPSEKAKAYKIQLEVLKKQGKRSDLTSDHFGPKLTSADKIAEQNQTSKAQIKRFVRLNYLDERLLSMVDNSTLSLDCGATLSFLPAEHQEVLCGLIADRKIVKPEMAKEIRQLSEDGDWSIPKVKEILLPPRPVKKTIAIKIKLSDITQYLDDSIDERKLAREFLEFLKQRKENNQ